MSAAIAIASGKGGTGKTTTCACLAIALCRENKKVLAIDCDFGLRNLDLALGLYDSVVFDLSDVISGTCSSHDAIIHHPKYTGLDFVCAPQDENKADFSPESFATFVRDLMPQYDYILLDCPASIGHAFNCAVCAANQAILVTTPQMYALRDAQKIADIITDNGITNARLIVNMLRTRHIKRGYSQNIDDIIDMVALPLIGIVPYDESISAYQNRQLDIMDNPKLMAAQAFTNTAKRLLGQRIPILKIKNKRFR